jgi:hypothetical protein
LAKDVEEHPHDPHPRYFYHRQCVIAGQAEEAIRQGETYLEMTRGGGFIQADVYGNMAIAYQQLGKMFEAQCALHLAAAHEPDRREWLVKLAWHYTQTQQWQPALAMARAAAELPAMQVRQWEPEMTRRIYEIIEQAQHELAHQHRHAV